MQYAKNTKLKTPYIGYKNSTNFAKPITEKGKATTTTKNIPLLYATLNLLRKK